MDIRELVGENLRRLRKAAGLSQEDLAHEAAIDRRHVGRIEGGGVNVTVDIIQKLAAALKVKPAALLDLESPAPKTIAPAKKRSKRPGR